jgi:AhpD family alkylhydroperoxidase
MRTLVLAAALALLASAGVAQEGGAPKFFEETYPKQALSEALALDGALSSEDAALDEKTRQLVSLAVAAQIPCAYCVHAHKRRAQAAGATDAEIRESVAAAAMVRHWSTVLNGMDYDLDAFKVEYDEMVPLN